MPVQRYGRLKSTGDPPDDDEELLGEGSPSDGQSNNSATNATEERLTTRSLAVGLFIGLIVCICNEYFALQTGWGSSMSLQSALLGFAMFKLASPLLDTQLTPNENVFVQTVASNAGTVCLASGFTAIVPTLQFLLKPSELPPMNLNLGRLIIWSLGTCIVGAIFSAAMWRQMIIKEDFPYPSGRATATLISVLHGGDNKHRRRTSDLVMAEQCEADGLLHGPEDIHAADSEACSGASIQTHGSSSTTRQQYERPLLIAFLISSIFTFATYFIPQARKIPILGSHMASQWLWTLDPSPAYIGQGALMGTSTTLHVFLGAVIGWGILSPLAKTKGWAPGPVDDWEHGSKGWLVWISLAVLLADSVVTLGVPLISACVSSFRTVLRFVDNTRRFKPQSSRSQSPQPESSKSVEIPPPVHSTVALCIALGIASIICIICVHLAFGSYFTIGHTSLGICLGMVAAVLVTRSLAETDLLPNGAVARLVQLIFAFIAPASNPKAVVINLLAASMSESSSERAGNTMQDYKVAQLVGAPAKQQLLGSVVGGVFGAIISPIVYRMYASVYELPSGLFQIPGGYLYLFAARLLTGQGLPPMAAQVGFVFALLSLANAALRMVVASHSSPKVRRWHSFVPSGIAVSIGMYTVPSFTLPRLIGGLFIGWYLRRYPGEWTKASVIASGLIIGEGIMSMINLLMASLGVPHL